MEPERPTGRRQRRTEPVWPLRQSSSLAAGAKGGRMPSQPPAHFDDAGQPLTTILRRTLLLGAARRWLASRLARRRAWLLKPARDELVDLVEPPEVAAKRPPAVKPMLAEVRSWTDGITGG
jgi:hypothetical protein